MGDKIINTPIEVDFKEFFRAFFPNDKSTIYFRTYDDRDKTKPGSNKEVDFIHLEGIVSTLQRENNEHRGVFFVVNGGGQTDKAVLASKSCTAQFMEMDEGTFEEQLEKINNFPIKPSIVTRTRKSLHTYWLLTDGNIKRFREIQRRLIKYFNSDPKIKNESRVMRVPGFYHCKEDPIRVEVIHFAPELRYTQEDLEKVLPEVEPEHKESKKQLIHGENGISSHRVDTLISMIGRYKTIGMSTEAIKIAISGVNETMCTPPISKERLEREVYPAIERWEAAPVLEPDKHINTILEKLKAMRPETRFKWDDKGNGSLFATTFKDRVRWNVTAKEWFYYDGIVWKLDDGGMIAARCAKVLANALVMYSTSIEDDTIRNNYQGHALKLGQLNNRKRMLEDAKDKYFLAADMFDKDKYLLNLQNGVLDLRTGDLMSHDPDLLLSKVCNASFAPGTRCERWESFVDEVMEGNPSKKAYLQKIIGYSLTGDTKEETCYILYGRTTRNGKSTLVETIGHLLGGTSGYALNMKPETLAMRKNNDSRQASGDIARLKDCRFLNASEPPKKMIFDVGLLKTLLGRDTITARLLYQNEFQFAPCFKLFMNTNFLPLITDDTLFSSGRLNVITFDRHFSEEEQDKRLKDLFRTPEAMSGILNWCLEGLRLYLKEGATPPEAVRIATEAYRELSDKVGLFIGEVLEPKPGNNLPAGKVYDLYQHWCSDNGYGRENKSNFFSELKAKGVFLPSGTVCGKTVRNVVSGYDVGNDFEEYDNGSRTETDFQYYDQLSVEIPFD